MKTTDQKFIDAAVTVLVGTYLLLVVYALFFAFPNR